MLANSTKQVDSTAVAVDVSSIATVEDEVAVGKATVPFTEVVEDAVADKASDVPSMLTLS